MKTARAWIPGAILHTMFWLFSSLFIVKFMFFGYMFGRTNCDPMSDDVSACVAEAHQFLMRDVLGVVWLMIGLLAVMGGWFGWRNTRYLFWILTASWLWFTVRLYVSVADVTTLFFCIPAIVYAILALRWKKSKPAMLGADSRPKT